MRIFSILTSALSLLLAAPFIHAETNRTLELAQMIKKMYSYSVHEFEYGRNPATDRYDPIKNCAMLRSYFDEAMLTQTNGVKKCEFDHSRFAPDEDGTPMEEVVTADGMNLPPPVPFIQSIKVNGEQAQVDILFGTADAPKGKLPDARKNQGRVVFYFKKKSLGWRVVNKLSFKKWPLKLADENSDCRMVRSDYHFAVEPSTTSDLAVLPIACQKLERPALHK